MIGDNLEIVEMNTSHHFDASWLLFQEVTITISVSPYAIKQNEKFQQEFLVHISVPQFQNKFWLKVKWEWKNDIPSDGSKEDLNVFVEHENLVTEESDAITVLEGRTPEAVVTLVALEQGRTDHVANWWRKGKKYEEMEVKDNEAEEERGKKSSKEK